MPIPNKITFTIEAQPDGQYLLTSPQAPSLCRRGYSRFSLLANAETYLDDAIRYEAAQKSRPPAAA